MARNEPKYRDITREIMESPANIAFDSTNPLNARITGKKWKVGNMAFSVENITKKRDYSTGGKRGRKGRFEGKETQFTLAIGSGMDITDIVMSATIKGKPVTVNQVNNDDPKSPGGKYRVSTFNAIRNAAKKVNGDLSQYEFLTDVNYKENTTDDEEKHADFILARKADRTAKSENSDEEIEVTDAS